MYKTNRVKEYREKSQFSQEYIARSIGCSLRHYQYIEQGKTTPTVYLAIKISELLNADIKELFKI